MNLLGGLLVAFATLLATVHCDDFIRDCRNNATANHNQTRSMQAFLNRTRASMSSGSCVVEVPYVKIHCLYCKRTIYDVFLNISYRTISLLNNRNVIPAGNGVS